MNPMNNSKRKPFTYILDATVIIHLLPNNFDFKPNDFLIVPISVIEEIKTKPAKMSLDFLIDEKVVRVMIPSESGLIKAKEWSAKTGDISHLSNCDLDVIALAFDHIDSIIISDDKAIQNVCKSAKIVFQPPFFRMKTQRQYFWRCIVCNEKYDTQKESCIECGSPVKRYYTQK